LAEHRLLGMVHQPNTREPLVDAIMAATPNPDATLVDSIMLDINCSSSPNEVHRTSQRALIWSRGAIVRGFLAVAASLLILLSVRTFYTRIVPRVEIATLLAAENCSWDSEIPLVEGQRLVASKVRLKSGLAVVRMDGGAEVVLRDRSHIDFLTPGSAKLHYGAAVVRAPEESAGFVMLTPASELCDLGTEFSVSVDNSGKTELSVFEGEVAVRPLANNDTNRATFAAGNAVRMETPRSAPQQIPSRGERFHEIIDNANLTSRWDLAYVHEGFAYKLGRTPLVDGTGGHGWAGPWRLRQASERRLIDRDASIDMNIVEGKTNITWPVPNRDDGMLELPPGPSVLIRPMKRPIELNSDGVFYFSCIVREPFHPEPRRNDVDREAIRITFRSQSNYMGETISLGLSTTQVPRISTGQGVGVRASSQAPSDQSTLWIGKLIAQREGPDQVSFRIFGERDELGCFEPSQWDVVVRDLQLTASLDLLVLTSNGKSPRIVDEIRIGPTWRSVVPVPERGTKLADLLY
jgi:hypothetical protein